MASSTEPSVGAERTRTQDVAVAPFLQLLRGHHARHRVEERRKLIIMRGVLIGVVVCRLPMNGPIQPPRAAVQFSALMNSTSVTISSSRSTVLRRARCFVSSGGTGSQSSRVTANTSRRTVSLSRSRKSRTALGPGEWDSASPAIQGLGLDAEQPKSKSPDFEEIVVKTLLALNLGQARHFEVLGVGEVRRENEIENTVVGPNEYSAAREETVRQTSHMQGEAHPCQPVENLQHVA